MATPRFNPVLHQIRRMAGDGRPPAEGSDEDLVRRFQADRDEAAFQVLLRRHGPMVLDVCRAVLRDEALAEDAFQTTFLVLARRPGSIRAAASLGSWLHGVAYRTALKARAGVARRRRHESRGPGRATPPADDLTWGEAQGIVHEELNALAERHRGPLVLCYLQGLTQDQAAARLGLSKGTLKRRLEDGRALLRDRLVRRGLGPAAALLASAWPAAAAVPATLSLATARAAALAAVGHIAPAGADLTRHGVKAVLTAKVRNGAAVVLALAAVGTGAVAVALRAGPADGPARPGQPPPAGAPAAEPAGSPRSDVFGDPLPAGALARMGTARLRHSPLGTLTTAFSADGKLLASCGDELRLWDAATGKLLREVRDGNRTRSYCELRFAPDGRRLAGASRQSVCVWDTTTGKLLHEFPADGHAAAWSPDGTRLACVAKDGTVTVWDPATGERTARFRDARPKDINPPAFSADGKRLATLSGDRVSHWDVAAGRLDKEVNLPLPPKSFASMSPDGRTVVIVTRDGPVSFRDSATGRERAAPRDDARGCSCWAFTADGQTMAVNETRPDERPDETTVAFWDTTTGAVRRRLSLPTRYVQSLRFSPDGRTLVTTGYDQTIHLWDVATGKPTLTWPAHTDQVKSLAFTPDGRSLVSGSLDGTVRLWDVATGRQVRELIGHRWRCDVVAVAPDGKSVLSGGIDGCVRVQGTDGTEVRRLLQNGEPAKLGRPANTVLALGVTPDGGTAVTWSRNLETARPTFHLWDLATGKVRVERRDPSQSGLVPLLSPDARYALDPVYENLADDPAAPRGAGAGGGGGPARVCVGVVLIDVATGREVLRVRDPGGFDGPRCFSLDGRVLVSATSRDEGAGDGRRYQNAVRVWELATGKERLSLQCGSADSWFRHAAVSPDSRTLATVRSDELVQVWDLATGKEVLTWPAAGAGSVTCVAFSPDGRALVTGHAEGSILVWDAAVAPPALGRPDARQIEGWWADLAGGDARRAYAAVRGLGGAPGPAVRFLRGHLRPVEEGPADRLRTLIGDLDSPEFQRREAASKELAALGEPAGPALRRALRASPSDEQRQRIGQLLRALDAAPTGEALRQVRAVEVLELAGTGDAREVLKALAGGASGARLTRDAESALQRLTRRPAGRD